MFAACLRQRSGDELRRGPTTGENPAGSKFVRRQTAVGRAMPAGSSRDERLDPFSLPVRFAATDKAADGRVRTVELTRERVVVRRAVRGIKMAVNLPVTAYLGVALRMEPPEGDDARRGLDRARAPRSTLSHFPSIAPTTARTSWPNGSRGRACSACRSWSPKRTDACAKRSTASAPFASPPPPGGGEGASAIRSRRPSILLRRKLGRSIDGAAVHRDEREIIARN